MAKPLSIKTRRQADTLRAKADKFAHGQKPKTALDIFLDHSIKQLKEIIKLSDAVDSGRRTLTARQEAKLNRLREACMRATAYL